MERAPKRLQDKDTQSIFDYIFRNAFGNPIIFEAVPSLSDMKANTWGVYSTTLYIKFANGTGISISGSALS